jgi:hypothetical protein
VAEARADEPNATAAAPIAVVELFTSDGCSSCPPADEALEALADAGDARIYPLAFHVDYWDELGWKDRFASPAFTMRQQAYAHVLGVRGLYTPQMIVNGAEELIGSDRARAQVTLSHALERAATLRVSIHSRDAGPRGALVDYEVSEAPPGAVLNVAVVERRVTTSVRAGENAGKTLRHTNVVRGLVTVPLTGPRGTVLVPIPSSLSRAGAELTAYVQRDAAPSAGGRGLAVLGASRTPLAEPSGDR